MISPTSKQNRFQLSYKKGEVERYQKMEKEIMEKMVEGKVKRFLGVVSLLSQGFVKDPEMTIQDYIRSENANIISFTRLKVGEGIEVETKDFADEVADQLK